MFFFAKCSLKIFYFNADDFFDMFALVQIPLKYPHALCHIEPSLWPPSLPASLPPYDLLSSEGRHFDFPYLNYNVDAEVVFHNNIFIYEYLIPHLTKQLFCCLKIVNCKTENSKHWIRKISPFWKYFLIILLQCYLAKADCS